MIDSESWLGGSVEQIKKFISSQVLTLFDDFTRTEGPSEWPAEDIDESQYKQYVDHIIKGCVEISATGDDASPDEEGNSIQERLDAALGKLRQLHDLILTKVDEPLREEMCQYFARVLKAQMLFFYTCFSFPRAIMNIGLLHKMKFGENEWEKEVLQHCLCTVIGMYGAGAGPPPLFGEDVEGLGPMMRYAKMLVGWLGISAQTLDYLIPRVATCNGLLPLRQAEIEKFKALGVDLSEFVTTEREENGGHVITTMFPDFKPQFPHGLSGRYQNIAKSARLVIEKSERTPLEELYRLKSKPLEKEDENILVFPAMPSTPIERLMDLKLCHEVVETGCEKGHRSYSFTDTWGKTCVMDAGEECLFCKLDLIVDPPTSMNLMFYPLIQEKGFYELVSQCDKREGQILEMFSDFAAKMDITASEHDMGPVETCLLRLLIYVVLLDKRDLTIPEGIFKTLNEKGQEVSVDPIKFFSYQILAVLYVLGQLLFPYTPAAAAIPAVELFVHGVFCELARRLDKFKFRANESSAAKGQNVPELLNLVFSRTVASIIPGVFENLRTIRGMGFGNAGKFREMCEKLTVTSPRCEFVRPPSWRYQLVEFLVSPTLRAQYPVVYEYLRLWGRLACVWLIEPLASCLRCIREQVTQNCTDIEDISWNTATLKTLYEHLPEKHKETAESFVVILPDVLIWSFRATLNGLTTPAMWETLMKSDIFKCDESIESLPLRFFLPQSPDHWVFLHILEGLSHGHNSFVRVLQREVGVSVREVEDVGLSVESKDERLDNSVLGADMVDCTFDKLAPTGLPVWDQEIEEEFIRVLSQRKFSVISHTSLQDLNRVQRAEDVGVSVVLAFDRAIQARPLTWEQKFHLKKYAGHVSTNVIEFCERVMLKVLKVLRSEGAQTAVGSQPIVTFIAEAERGGGWKLTDFEAEGYRAFSTARNSTQDEFVLAHFSRIHAFMTNLKDTGAIDRLDLVDDLIVSTFAKQVDIPESGYQIQGNWDTISAVVPKIIAAFNARPDVRWRDFAERPLRDVITEFEGFTDQHIFLSAAERHVLEQMKEIEGATGAHLLFFYKDARAKY